MLTLVLTNENFAQYFAGFTLEKKTFIFGVVFGISIDDNNENNVLLSQNNDVYKTIDGGQNWTPTESGLEVLEKDVDYIYDIIKNPFNKDQLLLSTT